MYKKCTEQTAEEAKVIRETETGLIPDAVSAKTVMTETQKLRNVENLIPDGSFENGFGEWRLANNSSAQIVQEYAGDGLRSCKMSKTGLDYVYRHVMLNKGRQYQLTYWIKSSGIHLFAPYLYYLDGSGSGSFKQFAQGSYTTGNGNYAYLATIELPDDAESQIVDLTLYGYGSAGTEGWLDDIRLTCIGNCNSPLVYGKHEYAHVNFGTSAKILKQADSGSQLLGTWVGNGYMKITGESDGGTFYKIVWGKEHFNDTTAYIRKSDVTRWPLTTSFVDRMCYMARSFDGQIGVVAFKYDEQDEGFDWCQSFLHNMAISAGLSSPQDKLPKRSEGASNTRDTLEWLERRSLVRLDLDSTTPARGDWLYTITKKDLQSGNKRTSHVSLVIDVNGYMVRTVDGNVWEGGTTVVRYKQWLDLRNIPEDGLGYFVALARPDWD